MNFVTSKLLMGGPKGQGIIPQILQFSTLSTFPSVGSSGNMYFAQDTSFFYIWSGSTYLQVFGNGATGPAGANGSNGTSGNTVWNGSSSPSTVSGAKVGDFYLNTTTSELYGPMTLSGSTQVWGSGVSLIGATGSTGLPGRDATRVPDWDNAPGTTFDTNGNATVVTLYKSGVIVGTLNNTFNGSDQLTVCVIKDGSGSTIATYTFSYNSFGKFQQCVIS